MIEIAKEAAHEAGAFLKGRFSQRLIPALELHNDVKLEEDVESERRIIEVLHRHFPTHTIISEEVGQLQRDDEYIWIVDPLDGTNNFFIGHPYFSISIALQHKGETVLGVVYNPISDQLFWAEKGRGAFLHEKRLSVSDRIERSRAVGTYIRGRDSVTKEEEWNVTKPLFLHTKRLIRTLAPALDWCLLAHGWIDYVVFHRSDIMDVAAGILIAQEAGAHITDWNGKTYQDQPYDANHLPNMLATNGRLHDQIRQLCD